ncbi:hypothetical protein [Streptomyces sp. NPDC014733]|uniref:hypothetical protein n=1 Tax=Streptomyces sp. NPDC014733 TaxID=3364885 RepID=UPI0036FE88E6
MTGFPQTAPRSPAGNRRRAPGLRLRLASGLVGAYAAAPRAVIADGSYRTVLDCWGPGAEALTTSQVNPPGPPRTP